MKMQTPEQKLSGLAASPGVAVGPAWWYQRAALTIQRETTDEPEAERARLHKAVDAAHADLAALIGAQRERLSTEELAIFEAQQLMAQDPDMLQRATAGIESGASAEAAWWAAIQQAAAGLEALDDPYFQARAADIRDVGERALRILLGATGRPELPDRPVVILADDLTPSDTVQFDADRVLAFCTAGGGPTSHAAILARRLGVPAVVGLSAELMQVRDTNTILVDGDAGALVLSPTATTLRRARERQFAQRRRQEAALHTSHEPAVTSDGVIIEVAANVGSLTDAEGAERYHADGIGLLRTEFLYLDRSSPPGEAEQIDTYHRIFDALSGKPVVVRTLDVGGDKPLPYLSLPTEANPFLGQRAIRLARERPELLRTQLRAVLRAGRGVPIRIMFPMVSTVDEIRWLCDLYEEVCSTLRAQAYELPTDIQLGMMVEVPAAALLANRFARHVDFFSIGTNDLAQYTLAADRTNPAVAALADGLDPAVLALLRMVTAAAATAGKWVGVCGEVAGDELAVPILLGLGVTELSVSPVRVPTIKAAVRRCSMTDARKLAKRALELEGASAVREVVHTWEGASSQ